VNDIQKVAGEFGRLEAKNRRRQRIPSDVVPVGVLFDHPVGAEEHWLQDGDSEGPWQS
jgi:hypothetical protein